MRTGRFLYIFFFVLKSSEPYAKKNLLVGSFSGWGGGVCRSLTRKCLRSQSISWKILRWTSCTDIWTQSVFHHQGLLSSAELPWKQSSKYSWAISSYFRYLIQYSSLLLQKKFHQIISKLLIFQTTKKVWTSSVHTGSGTIGLSIWKTFR